MAWTGTASSACYGLEWRGEADRAGSGVPSCGQAWPGTGWQIRYGLERKVGTVAARRDGADVIRHGWVSLLRIGGADEARSVKIGRGEEWSCLADEARLVLARCAGVRNGKFGVCG